MTSPSFILGIGDDWTLPVIYTDSSIGSLQGVGGSGFTHAAIAIAPPLPGGRQATATATVTAGTLSYALVDHGFGYDRNNPPAITIVGDGQGASATALIGQPIDLTGSTIIGELYLACQPASILEMTAANGGLIAIDAAAGSFTFLVSKTLTATAIPDNPSPRSFLNRLQVVVIDSLGHRETIAVFPILVFDPRTVDPGIFPQIQLAAAIAAGPAGPESTISVNGHTGAIQTLTAADVGAYTTAQVDAATAALQNQINAIAEQVAAISAAHSVPLTSFFSTVFSPLLLS